jgi:hypothetical protein
MTALLPRLSPLGVELVVGALSAGGQVADSALAAHVSYAASGGTRSDAFVCTLATALKDLAETCGFPDNSSQVARSKFDRSAAVLLAGQPGAHSGELLRDDVWAYLTCCKLLDVARWRFPDCAPARFRGGIRNVFQRLWMRGVVLDRGEGHNERWGLVSALSEDAAVAIFERPGLASTPRLARAIAEGWAQTAHRLGREQMEPVMRTAIKLIRLRNEIQALNRLPDVELAVVVGSAFHQASIAAIA